MNEREGIGCNSQEGAEKDLVLPPDGVNPDGHHVVAQEEEQDWGDKLELVDLAAFLEGSRIVEEPEDDGGLHDDAVSNEKEGHVRHGKGQLPTVSHLHRKVER